MADRSSASAIVRSAQTNQEIDNDLECTTLDEVVVSVVDDSLRKEVDFLKSDCEGAECSFLGCASTDTLNRIRFMAGEYHDLRRFWPVALKLMKTHYVNLIGDAVLGAFFCERHTRGKSLLRKTTAQALLLPRSV